jgi:hypothetical protein
VRQYPWFNEAQALLAKKYQIENNVKFNHQLQLAALQSNNRKTLFELIELTDIKNEIANTNIDANMTLITESERIPDQQVAKLEPQVITVETETIMEEKVTFENTTETTLIVNSVIEATIEQSEETTASIIEQNIAEAYFENEFLISIHEEEEKIASELKPELNLMESTQHPSSFTGWLKKYSKGSAINQPKQKRKITNLYHHTDDDEEFIDDLKVNLTEISSFGMQQHDEFVTETMAKIFIEQEKYDKAIHTFEKLSLLKPEKSAFFAAQISELKNKLS